MISTSNKKKKAKGSEDMLFLARSMQKKVIPRRKTYIYVFM